ncbi:thiol-activated cytolysin family protein [Ekhidna sp.]
METIYNYLKNLLPDRILVICLVILLSSSCGEDDLNKVENVDLTAILSDAGKTEPLGADKDEIVETSNEIENGFRYTYEKHDVTDNIESIVYLGLNDDIIWPGSIVKGERAHDFIYEPILLDRAPLTLSISLESSSTGEGITQEVQSPKLSTVRQGISDLIKKAVTSETKVPAKVDFKYERMYSQSQMDVFVGADVSYGAGSLNTKFDWKSSSEKTRVVAKYTQIYYSIDIDAPATPNDLFAPDISEEEAIKAIPSGSAPLYVSSVSYGMMALMFIESDYTEETIDQALDVAYGKGDLEAEIEVGLTSKNVLERSSISIVVYGGSTAGLNDLEKGLSGFLNVINGSKQFSSDSPGVPISYKFRHVADNTLALVTLTSQYTLVRKLQLEQKVRVRVNGFRIIEADDEGSGDANALELDRLNVWLGAYERVDLNSPSVKMNIPGYAIYDYSHGGDGHVVETGDYISVGNFTDISFNTLDYDFSLGSIELEIRARDYDSSSSNEEDRKVFSLPSSEFTTRNPHTFRLTSPDFKIDAEISIEYLN